MSRFLWSNLFTRKTTPAAGRRHKVRLGVEPLEERALLTAGLLDPTFGLGGLVTTNFQAAGQAVAIDPASGKILEAGYAFDPFVTGKKDFAVARYNPDGSLDTSFGSGGEVLIDFLPLLGADTSQAAAIALQSDGKIVVGGYASPFAGPSEFALTRLTADGRPDLSFGNHGLVALDFGSVLGSGGSDAINALAVQPDGKIVAAGQAYDPRNRVLDFALARFDANGNLDPSFGPGGGGRVVTNVSNTVLLGLQNSAARALALQSDGKIVAAGYASAGFTDDFAVARYNPDGTLDGSFNTSGAVLTTFGSGLQQGNDIANAVAVSGSDIVVAGLATPNANGGGERFALARYTANGQLDTSFAGTGKVTTQIGTSAYAKALIVQADGKAVVGGEATVADPNVPGAGHYDFALARYNVDGSLDGTFNPGGSLPGTVTTSFGPNSVDEVDGLALQADGKIVAAGLVTDTNGLAFGLARYLASTGTVQITPPAPVTEGQTATITLTRSDTSGPASVVFSTSDGTAHAGTDYVPVTQTVTFAPGQASTTVAVATLDDNAPFFDPARRVNLTLSSPSGVALAAQSTAALTIQEPAPAATIEFGQASFAVGENGGSISIPVTRSGDTSGAASVNVAVIGGSATRGRDFEIANPTVNFAAGQAQASVQVSILNDGAFDGNETVALALTAPVNAAVGAQATSLLTINETNPPPPPPHRAVFAELVPVRMGRRSLLMLEVLYADTGVVKTEFLSPMQQPTFRGIQVSTVQGNGAGIPDQVLLTGRRGRRLVNLDIPV
jgi:uncharacterized delta-60 repeat protein